MTTQAEQAAQLTAIAAEQAATSAKLDEAFAELSGFPALVAQLQVTIADLQAASTGILTPEQQAALDAVQASATVLSDKAAALANIVT